MMLSKIICEGGKSGLDFITNTAGVGARIIVIKILMNIKNKVSCRPIKVGDSAEGRCRSSGKFACVGISITYIKNISISLSMTPKIVPGRRM